jgi:hypothetical protein
VYDESSAIVLQQWNVVKKNKMGTKQERVMGIDGKFIYNSVRGQPSGKGVKVPLREISSVASVEILDERMMRLEKSIVSVLSILKKIVATPQGAAAQHMDNQE